MFYVFALYKCTFTYLLTYCRYNDNAASLFTCGIFNTCHKNRWLAILTTRRNNIHCIKQFSNTVATILLRVNQAFNDLNLWNSQPTVLHRWECQICVDESSPLGIGLASWVTVSSHQYMTIGGPLQQLLFFTYQTTCNYYTKHVDHRTIIHVSPFTLLLNTLFLFSNSLSLTNNSPRCRFQVTPPSGAGNDTSII